MAIDDLYGKILAFGARVIRQQTSLPALVNHTTTGDRSTESSKGGITEVIIPPEFATRDVVPAANAPTSQAAPAPTTVQIPLDFWKEVNFPLTTKHIALIENASTQVPMFLANAVSPIVEDMTASIAATYKGIYGYVGTAGTTPFATSPVAIQAAKKVLTRQKCPRFNRQVSLNTDAYANAIALDQFSSEKYGAGQSIAITEGMVPRAYGFDWHEDVGLDEIEHTAGTAANYLVDAADVEVGDSSVNIDTGTGTYLVGDIFTVAGDDQTYAVTANELTGGNDVALAFTPPAKVAWANNAAITFKASHALNLAFHPFAFGFDSRPAARLQMPGVTSNFMTWVDDETGVVLRLEIRDEYHQTGFYMSCLWGAKLVDERLAARIAG